MFFDEGFMTNRVDHRTGFGFKNTGRVIVRHNPDKNADRVAHVVATALDQAELHQVIHQLVGCDVREVEGVDYEVLLIDASWSAGAADAAIKQAQMIGKQLSRRDKKFWQRSAAPTRRILRQLQASISQPHDYPLRKYSIALS